MIIYDYYASIVQFVHTDRIEAFIQNLEAIQEHPDAFMRLLREATRRQRGHDEMFVSVPQSCVFRPQEHFSQRHQQMLKRCVFQRCGDTRQCAYERKWDNVDQFHTIS